MAGTTKVAIWNLALQHIAQRPIQSDTDGSLMALACQRAWDPARREVLRECNWDFAAVIEQLSVVGAYTPPLGWAYGYQYPSRAIAVRKVFPPQEPAAQNGLFFLQQQSRQFISPNQLATPIRQTTGDKFRVIFDKTLAIKIILSNTQNAIIEYTYDVDDTQLFDASAVTLMGYRLAADIATPLTGDSSIAVNLSKIYNARLSVSQQINSTEDNTRALGDISTVDSRG